jgi:hypothetical protein
MATLKECRQRAKDCLQLASAAEEIYVKIALTELAEDFEKKAVSLTRGQPL